MLCIITTAHLPALQGPAARTRVGTLTLPPACAHVPVLRLLPSLPSSRPLLVREAKPLPQCLPAANRRVGR